MAIFMAGMVRDICNACGSAVNLRFVEFQTTEFYEDAKQTGRLGVCLECGQEEVYSIPVHGAFWRFDWNYQDPQNLQVTNIAFPEDDSDDHCEEWWEDEPINPGT